MRPDATSPRPQPSLEELVGEFVDRRLSGDAVSLEALCALHPDLSVPLRERLQAFEFLDAAMAPDEPPFARGDVHGDYRIEELLGQGGMGFVYRATQISLARPVAVKVAVPVTSGSWFRREARAAARVQHPHVVRVLAFEVLDSRPAIVMEYVAGESLSARLRRGVRDATADLVRQAVVLADALRAIHDQGVLHGDLKPANVLITADGRALVADFGLAHLREDLGEGRAAGWGTPAYMSPEQVRGEPASVASDLHALGATLYAWLAGRPPYQGRDAADLRDAILHAPLTPLAALRPDCPPSVAAVIERCLAKDPASRPRTAAEVGAALRDGASGAPPRSRRRLIGGLVTVILLLGCACAWLAHRNASDWLATLVARGELALQQASFASAADYFDRAIAQSARPDGKLLFQRADAHLQEAALQDESLAPARVRALLAELEAAYAAGFSSAGLHYARALLLLGFLGDRTHGHEALACAQALPLATAEDYFHQGGILSYKGDREGSAACYREALRRQPASLVCYYQLAFQLQAISHWDEAASVLDQALRLYPDHDWLLGLQGWMWLRNGRVAEGESLLRELADRRPAHRSSVWHLIKHLRDQDRDQEVIELLDELIADEPEQPCWRFERTASLIRSRQLSAAEPELAALMASYPEDLMLHGLQISLMAHRGEVARATAALREMASRDGAPWTLKTIADVCRPLRTPEPSAACQPFFRTLRELLGTEPAR
jgi:tetratricopeptide (TPR) repeat protein/predicted Ser/Thr protein kinase